MKESKLVNIIEGGGDPGQLQAALSLALSAPDGFERLSSILGHDPGDQYDNEDDEGGEPGGDCLDPESLREDPGWTWDCVRDGVRDGNTELLSWLGMAPSEPDPGDHEYR